MKPSLVNNTNISSSPLARGLITNFFDPPFALGGNSLHYSHGNDVPPRSAKGALFVTAKDQRRPNRPSIGIG